MIGLFLKNCIEKQAAIEKAIDDQEPKELNASAHSFKGLLVIFSKQGAKLTSQLEKIGASGKLNTEKVNSIYDNLKIVVDQIVPKLKEYKRTFEGQK